MDQRSASILELGLYVFAGITLLVLPANFFDTGPVVCFSQAFFDRPCLGCGMTRACMHLIHLEFATALDYHPLCVVVAPVLATSIALRCWTLLRRTGWVRW